MASGKSGGAKGRMKTADTGFGGAKQTGVVGEGYESFQSARNAGKDGGSKASGKVGGSKARMSGNCQFGATEHDSTIVDPKVGPGPELGRTAKQMGPTGTVPKGQYADRMHVAGGFGGKAHNGGIND